jgi:Carboxypeptidase regulatory-like domain
MLTLKNAPLTLALVFCMLSVIFATPAVAQSVASGTIEGTVVDASGGVVTGAAAEIRNPITGYQQTTTTDSSGTFHFNNVPFNSYHLRVTQPGFATAAQDVNVRSTVLLPVKFMLAVAGVTQNVEVEASGADIVDTVPFAHSDVDSSLLLRLPTSSTGSGLSDAVTLTAPGVVADSNGFFHPLGDHAQTSFAIDGQPISDQQSKAFSTQMPVDAIQSMEVISGTPNAEYGDKTSLVINTTTKSGLGLTQPKGNVQTEYGSFGTISGQAALGIGGPKAGWFMAANGARSGRFLDTPEFNPMHAIGNNQSLFNRFDFANGKDAFHVNVFLARNWFQTPNTFDQPDQDQRQKVVTYNIAPGYQRTISARSLLTLNPFVRQDRVNYYPSDADTPLTVSQDRHLTNWGFRGDVSYANGKHNVKIGGQVMQTRLTENFSLGITDFAFNPVCLNRSGDPQELPTVRTTAGCAARGFVANPDFIPGLIPLDLTRGGTPFLFDGTGNINEYSAYIQDSITIGHLTLNPGLRIDRYKGFTTDTQAQPRFGISYLLGSTVLRAGYARTMETPYNENLLVAASGKAQVLVDAFSEEGQSPVEPGHRNQYNVGLQQAVGRYLQIDADYFWKLTHNAYDFGVIGTTPIAFPISWDKSKLDGISLRVSTTNLKGFQWFTTMGHNRARFFPIDAGPFRIDHDQKFQQTSNVRYQWKNSGPWAAMTWRYDSGLVAGSVTGLEDALALSGAEQAAIGFSCGNDTPSPDHQITRCPGGSFDVTRLRIPENPDDDHDPPRIAPRHLFDLAFGTDNLFRQMEEQHVTLRFTISNIANKIALYNFQSTFSGTHFVAPRSYAFALGYVF